MKTAFLSIALVGSIAGVLHPNPAFAGCNAFGCSQSSAADCNAFGCPNPPMGASYTAFGCQHLHNLLLLQSLSIPIELSVVRLKEFINVCKDCCTNGS